MLNNKIKLSIFANLSLYKYITLIKSRFIKAELLIIANILPENGSFPCTSELINVIMQINYINPKFSINT